MFTAPFQLVYKSSAPVLAVLVATCNRPGSLAQRSLTAIQRQTRRPDYLVVVDDSDAPLRPDNRNIVNDLRLNGCRIVYLTNSRTQGASGAWNTGLDWLRRHAGDPRDVLVAMLDDDDEWEPEHLAVCTAAAISGPCDMVAASIVRITGTTPPRPQAPPDALEAGLFLVGNPHIQGSNLFVRLSALLEAGTFDESLRSCTDRDLCIRLADLGWVRYSGLPNLSVKHFADAARPRLSSPKDDPKKQGLDRFWSKWHGRMSSEQRQACLDRAKALFNWEPSPDAEPVTIPLGLLVPSKEPSESERVHADDLVLIVGVIADDDHAGQCARLFDDLLSLQSFDQICCLDVVVLHNGGSRGIERLTQQYRTRGLSLFLATEPQQVDDAAAGVLGPGFVRPPGRAPIGPARTMLQSYVTRVASQRPGAIAWILDDDSRLDNCSDRADAPSFQSLLASLGQMRSLGVDVVLGTVTGDPPIPPGSTVRTQLVDLYHNLGWLSRMNAADALPDRRPENRAARAAARDYYYDLSRRDTHHLEWPFWITPQRSEETVGNSFVRMVDALPRILAGQGVFRPLLLDSPFDSIASMRPSVQRGTNTFVFDCAAFSEFPNLAPRFAGDVLRRSDMIWALLNRYAGGRRIVGATLPIRHDRTSEAPIGLDLGRLVPDIRGYALYSALEDVLVRRRERRLRDGLGAEVPDDLSFRKGDLDLAESRFKKYLTERTAALLMSCWRIQGLCDLITRGTLGPALADTELFRDPRCTAAVQRLVQFLTRTREQFAIEKVEKVVESVLDVPGDEVRDFLRGLSAMVKQHRSAKAFTGEDAWFRQERIAAASAVAQSLAPSEPLRLLGTGGEGVVFAASDSVVKVIDYSKRSAANGAWLGMQALMASTTHGSALCRCSMPSAPGSRKVIRYPLEDGEFYVGGQAADIIGILRECRAVGVVTANFHPKNLLRTKAGVRLIDYGSDIRPFSEQGFRSMVQRAWLTLRFHDRNDLSELMRRALADQTVPELEGWESLLAAIEPPSKREVIDDAVLDIARRWKPVRVLDFGCGHGRIAAALAQDGARVVAFDPDGSLADRWQVVSKNGLPIEWCTGDADEALAGQVGAFDLVICSLVLCVIGDDQEYLATIRRLSASLSPKGRFIIVICDPDATLAGDSTMQRRLVPEGASIEQTILWTKELPSGNRRGDVHRPRRRVLKDLAAVGLRVDQCTSTGGLSLDSLLPSWDNLFLIGAKSSSDGIVCLARPTSRRSVERSPVDVPVLCYHRVLPRDHDDPACRVQRRRGTVVDLEVFKQQIRDIERRFIPVTLARYVRWLDGDQVLPANSCLVTFDDGYRDFLDHAMPALAAAQCPCVLFPTMCAAAGDDHLPVDALYAALSSAELEGRMDVAEVEAWISGDRKRSFVRATREEQRAMLAGARLSYAAPPQSLYLSEGELAALPTDLVMIGGHGERHELLAGRGITWQRREFRRVRFWLERVNRGRPECPSVFAFPNGTHDSLAVAATVEAGFDAAFSVVPWQPGQYAHRWALRRSCIPNRTTAIQELADGKEVRL